MVAPGFLWFAVVHSFKIVSSFCLPTDFSIFLNLPFVHFCSTRYLSLHCAVSVDSIRGGNTKVDSELLQNGRLQGTFH